LAEGALEEAVRYVKERKAFGRTIGEFQGMRWKIAEMYKDIEGRAQHALPGLRQRRPVPGPESAVARVAAEARHRELVGKAIPSLQL
jgi:alkylation response protein AidB-like acyl-CoA dehydrogenase